MYIKHVYTCNLKTRISHLELQDGLLYTVQSTNVCFIVNSLEITISAYFILSWPIYHFNSWSTCYCTVHKWLAVSKEVTTARKHVWIEARMEVLSFSVCLTSPWMRPISSALARGVTVWYKNKVSSSGLNHCWPLLLLLFLLAPATGGSARASTLNDGWMGRIDLKIYTIIEH